MASSRAVLDLIVELKGAAEAQSGLSALGGGVSGLGIAAAAGSAAVVGAVGAIGAAAWNVAGDINDASNQMQAALGLNATGAAYFEDAMKNIFANNFGADMDDIANSLVSVEQAFGRVGGALGSDMVNIEDLTQEALALRDVFGIDVAESANAAATLMQEFGLTGQEAMDFITTGFQNGLNASDDFLDTIGEYSTQFSEGGADASQFFSLLQSGMQGGMLGTDKAADAFKEFRVRIQDGSDATYAALEQIGISADDLLDRMSDGSTTAAEAWDEVQAALVAVDDENIRMRAGVALIGTQFEDLGQDAALAMSMTGASLEHMAGAADSLNVKYNDLGSAMEGFKRQALLAIEPLGAAMLELVNAAMPTVQAGFAWLGEQLPGWIQLARDAWTTFQQAISGDWVDSSMVHPFHRVVGVIGQVINAFGEGGLQGALAVILPYAQEAFNGLVTWIQGQLPGWIATLQSWATAAWQWLSDAVPPLLEAAGRAFVGLLTWVQEQLPGWLATLGEWATEAVVWLSDAIPPLLLAAADFLSSLLTWANTEVLPKLIDIGSDMAEALYEWVTEILIPEIGPKLLDFMWEMDQKIRNEILPQIRGAAEQVGQAIINGISRMVSDGAGAIADVVRNAINGAINAAKEALGINSPSKVFAEIGVQTMQGLAAGINTSAMLPVTATAGAVSGMVGAGTAAGAVNINLNGVSLRSDEDIDALAYKVARHIRNRR